MGKQFLASIAFITPRGQAGTFSHDSRLAAHGISPCSSQRRLGLPGCEFSLALAANIWFSRRVQWEGFRAPNAFSTLVAPEFAKEIRG